MKRHVKALCALGLSVGLAAAIGASAQNEVKKVAKVGEAAPAFTLKDLTGKEHKLADYKGKLIVLDWVSPRCPVCRGAHKDGRIPSMVKELKKMDVVFLGINSSHFTDVKENDAALKDYGLEYTVLLDTPGTVGRSYDARTTPHIFVIDTQGVLRYQGALDDDRTGDKTKNGQPVTNYALNAIKQIKAGETVTPQTTQSYGCSVKYQKKE